MNVVITNSPVIPSGEGAGIPSVGTYVEFGGYQWILQNPSGWEGAIFLTYQTDRWELASSYGTIIALSQPVAISVHPWQATWPSPMVVALETTCDPRYDAFAYGDECGEHRFKRLWTMGYV